MKEDIELLRITKQKNTLIQALKQIKVTFEQLDMQHAVEKIRLLILANEK